MLGRLFGRGREKTGLRCIVGLGNPGAEYEDSRHNVGWWLLDHLAEAWELGRTRRRSGAVEVEGRRAGLPVRLVKPLTYMNRSGAAIAPLLRVRGFDPRTHLLVVVDDVSLPPGRARFRARGSPGGHKGLRSVEAVVGGPDYPRLRIGVGQAPRGHDLSRWVLAEPPPREREAILGLLPELADGVEKWLTRPMEEVMSRFNR